MGHPEKEYEPIFTALKEQGFEVNKTQRGHYEAISPDKSKPLVFFAVSAERCAKQNTIRDLRRAGFKWDDHEPKSVGDGYLKNALQKAGIGRNNANAADVPLVFPPPPADSGVAPVVDMDTLFRDLKEKKEMAQLCKENHYDISVEAAAIQKKLGDAWQEVCKADSALAESKRQFDEYFNAEKKTA
jgi:hypothetical protein